MKLCTIGLATALIFTSCAGIERINASHKTDSQLKLRWSQLNRELMATRWGDTALHDVSMLESERDAIERELLSRCEAGRSQRLPRSILVALKCDERASKKASLSVK